MSTYTSEPGIRLAGRYRLVDQVSAGSGWTMWKATDETLARPVSVLTFAAGFPRIPEVVTAARAASRLTDSRLAQVFDVEDGGDLAYVVMEWVSGDTLADLITEGPLEPARACALVLEAAQALAAAHAAGQAHLRLTPHSLRWTRSSGVKVTGLGIVAALAGSGLADTDDPALTDTRDLAGLLYAALTGYWPREPQTGLPPAPIADGIPCTPRQVSANVPPAIDAVVTRALLQRPVRQAPPILTPGAFADALYAVAPPVPLPEPALPFARGAFESFDGGQRGGDYPSNPDNPDTWAASAGAPYQRWYPPSERSVATRAVISVVIVLVLAAVAAAAWAVSSNLHKSSSGGQAASGSQSAKGKGSAAAPTSTVLKPAGITTFNIFGSDSEDAQDAAKAIDGNPATFWHTEFYLGNSKFGGLKQGTGLILNMGRRVRLSQVQALFGSQCCTTAEIYLGNSNVMSTNALSHFTLVGASARVSGSHVYTINSNATGRYVLLWITNLPPLQGQPGAFEAQVYNIAVRGSAASSTG